MIFAVLIFALA
ncbi:putative membrane protein, partial [Vibrio parahaemolyticus EKP-028]